MNRMNLLAAQVVAATGVSASHIGRDVEVAIESMNLASAELQTGLETIEDISADAIALENYAELAGSFQGGMNAQSAVVLQHGANHLASRWGVTVQSVGTESFDDNPTMATQVACEGIKDVAASLWDGFLDMLKKIRAAVKDALAKYFNAGTKLKKAFEKLEDKIDDLGEIKDGKDKVSGDFLKTMVINGSFEPAALKAAAEALDKEVNAAANGIDAATKSVIATAEKSPEEHAAATKTMFDASLEYKSVLVDNKLAKSFEKLFGGDKAAGKFKVGMVIAFPRDCYAVFAMNEAGVEHVKYLAGVNLDAADKDIATLSTSDMSSWISAGIKAAESLEAIKKDWQKVESAGEKLLSEVDKIGKKAKSTKDDEKEAAKGWKKIHRGMNTYSKNMANLERGITDSVKNAAQGIYGYVAASASQYNKA